MKKILNKIESTFDTKTPGYSARKLSAFFAIVLMGGISTYKYTDRDNLVEVLTIWLVFASACLGMITAQNIISFKNGTDTKSIEQTNEG